MGDLVASTTHHSHDRAEKGSLIFDAGVTSIKSLIGSLPTKPAVAVLLFGESVIDKCAKDPSGTALLNVVKTKRVIDELRDLGIKPVFTSSDAVFDGTRPWSREEDPARPILTYGRQKLEIEGYVAASASPWLVIRLPKLLSEDCDPRCMLTDWTEKLETEVELRCATDQYFTPAAVTDVAAAIAELVKASVTGLFHLASPSRLSRRELLTTVADEFAKHARLRARITDCSIKDFPFEEARPLDTSLCSNRVTPLLQTKLRDASVVARSAVRACVLGRCRDAPSRMQSKTE